MLTLSCIPRVDLRDEPIENADLNLYVDGSASRDELGTNRAAYAVVTQHDVVDSGKLPSHYSVQAAELVALTKACEYARDKSVNIWTDSRYAWGVTHDFGLYGNTEIS